MIDAYVRVVT